MGKLVVGWYQWIPHYLMRGNMESVYMLGKSLLELYECLTITLFFCLTWSASQGIQSIIDDVENYSPAFHPASGHRVMLWSRSYCLMINFIDQVNRFFELTLFLFILKEFVFFFLFLTSVVGLIDSVASHNPDVYLFQVVSIIKNLALFLMVIIGVQNMKRKVCFPLNSYLADSINYLTRYLFDSRGGCSRHGVDHAAIFQHHRSIRSKFKSCNCPSAPWLTPRYVCTGHSDQSINY